MNQLRTEAPTYEADTTQTAAENTDSTQELGTYSGDLALRGSVESVPIAYRNGYDEFME
jgi:hypothetical protein